MFVRIGSPLEELLLIQGGRGFPSTKSEVRERPRPREWRSVGLPRLPDTAVPSWRTRPQLLFHLNGGEERERFDGSVVGTVRSIRTSVKDLPPLRRTDRGPPPPESIGHLL